MTSKYSERIRENLARGGGRPARRTMPEPTAERETTGGPGKKAEEMILSIPTDEILPDRYQGRLRWPVDLSAIERLYAGEWDAQDLLDYIAGQRAAGSNPALDEAWHATVELARSILSEGQVVPITVVPARGQALPVGYRFVIETGEGRYWAYHMMRWLLTHMPEELDVPTEEWREDPAFVRAVAVADSSRLRQVAENEQRQSYASAVDRAVAYASMLAEEARYEIVGPPPGIRNGALQLPDAYWRAAKRGLRGRKAVLQQVPAGERQIQRHLKLLTALDPVVLAHAKQNGLSEAQLRSLIGKPMDEQRERVRVIIEEGLSSRQAAALLEEGEDREGEDILSATLSSGDEQPMKTERPTLTLMEEVTRLLRSLTSAAGRYEALRARLSDEQLVELLEAELRSYDATARGAQRQRTPRRRVQRLQSFLERLE